ncbi:hypothetical protein KKF32_02950 [Patescibacteria group bacterium]|nr:hypothetical protein [Patescibacteria group bacterium]
MENFSDQEKKITNNNRWLKWTFLEAGTRAVNKALQKVIGVTSSSIGHTFYAIFLVGLVQTVVGSAVIIFKKKKVLVESTHLIGALLFGILAFFCTTVSFIVFLYGGEVGVNTFIITLSIVPGAFIDWIFFKHRLFTRQWLGVMIAIWSGYFVLNCPSLKEVMHLPLWVFLSLATMMAVAINQGITQKIKRIDPMVKNFWGGLMTAILGIGGLLWFNLHYSLNFSDFIRGFPSKLIWISIIFGIIVILMWIFNLLAYKGGAYIALKKLVMNGSYLTMAMIIGILLFGEAFTIYKLLGFLFYCFAFILMDSKTWNFITGKFQVVSK